MPVRVATVAAETLRRLKVIAFAFGPRFAGRAVLGSEPELCARRHLARMSDPLERVRMIAWLHRSVVHAEASAICVLADGPSRASDVGARELRRLAAAAVAPLELPIVEVTRAEVRMRVQAADESDSAICRSVAQMYAGRSSGASPTWTLRRHGHRSERDRRWEVPLLALGAGLVAIRLLNPHEHS
jgi:hypothetical protein